MPKIYIVDIDGTICQTPKDEFGNHDYPNSKPLVERIKKINAVFDTGATVIYWTARGSSSGRDWTELTTAQLNEWGCKYHTIVMGKPSYDVWIDDKAMSDGHFFRDTILRDAE